MRLYPNIAVTFKSELESLFISQLKYWLDHYRDEAKTWISGRQWIFNSIDEWLEQFPWVSRSKLERCINRLRELGIVLTQPLNKGWRFINGRPRRSILMYSLDYERLEQVVFDATGKPAFGNGWDDDHAPMQDSFSDALRHFDVGANPPCKDLIDSSDTSAIDRVNQDIRQNDVEENNNFILRLLLFFFNSRKREKRQDSKKATLDSGQGLQQNRNTSVDSPNQSLISSKDTQTGSEVIVTPAAFLSSKEKFPSPELIDGIDSTDAYRVIEIEVNEQDRQMSNSLYSAAAKFEQRFTQQAQLGSGDIPYRSLDGWHEGIVWAVLDNDTSGWFKNSETGLPRKGKIYGYLNNLWHKGDTQTLRALWEQWQEHDRLTKAKQTMLDELKERPAPTKTPLKTPPIPRATQSLNSNHSTSSDRILELGYDPDKAEAYKVIIATRQKLKPKTKPPAEVSAYARAMGIEII